MKEQYIEIDEDGDKYYYSDKEMNTLHREDGPAVIIHNGTKYWFLNGKTHRENGPAVEYSNGNKYWYHNGKFHREDGPAVEKADDFKEWWLNGFKLSEEQFNKEIEQSKKFVINGKSFTVVKSQYIEINELKSKFYYSDKEMTVLHREDGPACEWSNGAKWWCINSEFHREDGPAIEECCGEKRWYLDGVEYSEEEFHKKIEQSKKIGINGKSFTVEELNSLIAKL